MSGGRTPTPISEQGAKIAAARIGCTVEEYRQHEAIGEKWCALGQHWAQKRNADRCRPCSNAYARRRYIPQRGHVPGLRNVRYAGPAYATDARVVLTPEGRAVSSVVPTIVSAQRLVPSADPAPSGPHAHCPSGIRHLCEGRLPEGWVRASEVAS